MQLELDLHPPRLIVRLIGSRKMGGNGQWRKGIDFECLHTWVVSQDASEKNKLLVVHGKSRKDTNRYCIGFPNELEVTKFLNLLQLFGSADLYKCVALHLPTTEAQLRRGIEIDASWAPVARKNAEIPHADPTVSINGTYSGVGRHFTDMETEKATLAHARRAMKVKEPEQAEKQAAVKCEQKRAEQNTDTVAKEGKGW